MWTLLYFTLLQFTSPINLLFLRNQKSRRLRLPCSLCVPPLRCLNIMINIHEIWHLYYANGVTWEAGAILTLRSLIVFGNKSWEWISVVKEQDGCNYEIFVSLRFDGSNSWTIGARHAKFGTAIMVNVYIYIYICTHTHTHTHTQTDLPWIYWSLSFRATHLLGP